MRRIVIWAMSTLTVLVLLFSYSTSRSSTSAATAETRSGSAATRTTTGGGGSASSGDSTSQEPSTTDTIPGATAAQTFAGDAVMTRYGNVQVQITVASGTITAVDVLQVPMEDRHDQRINSQAVPIYNSEVVDAQSAQIDVVSGATVTWEGYTQSLQSAIDQAHL